MKKTILYLSVLILAFAVAACNGGTDADNEDAGDSTKVETQNQGQTQVQKEDNKKEDAEKVINRSEPVEPEGKKADVEKDKKRKGEVKVSKKAEPNEEASKVISRSKEVSADDKNKDDKKDKKRKVRKRD